MRNATLQYAAGIPLPEDDLAAIEILKGYGLEVVRVEKVGGKNYWHIKIDGAKTLAAPGRFMDWNAGTLEIYRKTPKPATQTTRRQQWHDVR